MAAPGGGGAASRVPYRGPRARASRPSPRRRAAGGLAAALALLGAGPAAATTPAAADSPREIRLPKFLFAVEDTTDLPAFFHMDSLRVTADRIGIAEIVQRCLENERASRARFDSLEYVAVSRFTARVGKRGSETRRWVAEEVTRYRWRRGRDPESVELRAERWIEEDGKTRPWAAGNPPVSISWGDLDRLPFYLEEARDYDFEITGRDLLTDRVIYRVRLRPASDFALAPSGTIWIDSTDFRILREEFDFGDRVPLPLLLKRVGPFVRERARVGDAWVWKRWIAQVELKAGWLRWLDGDLPDSVDLVVVFRDHRVNGRAAEDDLSREP